MASDVGREAGIEKEVVREEGEALEGWVYSGGLIVRKWIED